MKKFLLFVMSAVVSTASFAQLELTGVLDLGLSGNSGKAVHLTATAAIADLSTYGIGVANNGGGTDGVEYVFPAVAAASGDEILVVRDSLALASYFGTCWSSFDHVFVDPASNISQNGDDAIELFLGTAVIETFGDINVDGTGQPWEYMDSWAYKVSGNWTYGGVNCTDNTLFNDSSSCPYPFCPLPPANITFQVDMSTYTATFGAAYVNGTFNNWCGTCNPMTDANNDGIWEVTLPLTQDSIEYKFTLDGWTVDEIFVPGGSCTKTTGGFTNRFLVINGDATLPVVCWESCTSCAATLVSDVTFQLDMSTYTGAFTTPYVSGTFNNWSGGANPMSDTDGDGIWEATISITGPSAEYKFQVDQWAADESLTPGDFCTLTTSGFTNRFISLSGNVTLPAVCWASCSACPATGCPITTVPTTTDGVTCGPNGAILTATAGTPQNYLIWADSSVTIVGQGDSIIAPVYAYDYTFTAHEAFPAASAPTLNGPPSATITTGGFGNFSNGMYFSAQSFFRWDSVTVTSNGDVSGFIVIRDSNPSQNPNARILQFTPFSVTGAGTHTIPVDLTVAPGSYYANIAYNPGITGQLFRSTAGASYPYTVTNVMSVDSAWLGAGSTGNLARVYYFFDWQVTEVCVSAGTPATAFYSSGSSTTLPYSEDFESGIPCDWSLVQNTGSAGWLGGDSAALSSQFWSIPAHTNFAASNDDACNCDMSNDLMISHVFDFSTQGALNDLQLAFEYYSDGSYGSTGTFWYASQGSGPIFLDSMATNTAWSLYTKDINFLAGNDSVVFIFKHDDGGIWADGFAVDNFSITNSCAGENVTISVTTDSWGSETTWSLTDATTGAVLASGGPYPDGVLATYTTDICAPAGALVDFVINDSFGDGLTDGVNTGSYSVDIDCGGTMVSLTSGSGAFAYGGPSGQAPSYDSAQFALTCPPPVCDDFESYTAGDFASQSTDWAEWDNAAQDAVVTSAQANSGTQSIHINTLGTNGYSDIVREFGAATTGVHEVAMSIYVPSTDGGYFNLMHDYNVGGPNTWAIEVYLDGTAGSGVIQYGSSATGGTIGTFGFTPDAWNDMVFVIDLDNDWAEAWVNGSPIVGWQWSDGNTGVYGAFDAVNLYSAAPAGLSANMYVDDFCFQASSRVPVTFQVDMSQETVSADGVHIAGDFQGWNPGVTRLSDNGSGVYSYTSYLLPNSTYEFKFVNGNAWGTDESVPSACAQNNNRFVQVGASAVTTPLVCFGSCTTCTTAQPVSVTFQVDMSQETVSADGVHIAGEFQGWDPAGTPMTDQGNGVYAVTIDLDPNATYEYKFINGNAWGPGIDESVPAACAQNNNRFVQVGASNLTVPLVCFASCIECQVGVEDNALAQAVALYPNPSNGIVNFDFNFESPTNVAITIYNALGHVVAEVQETSMTAGTSRLDATQWASGIYTVRVSGMNETMIRQLVIQR